MSKNESVARVTPARRIAWILILVVDVGFVAWGAMAALLPGHLLGPDSAPILPAEYEGFTRGSWQELEVASPRATGFMTLLFRTYGAYNVAVGLLAMAVTIYAFRRGESWAWWALLVSHTLTLGSAITYDRLVNAIGPFELSEYVGLIMVYGALAATAPSLASRRLARSPG